MSIRKMTFSLASLILIFGLVFGTTSVLAHAPDDETVGPHDHPVLEAVVEDTTATPPVLPVPIHNDHPRVQSITLKAGDTVRGNMVAVDATTNTTFTVVVTFDRDVVGTADSADTTGNADGDLANNELGVSILNVDNTAATAPTFAVTRVANSHSTFEIVVTPAAYPTGTADANDETLRFRIQVNAGAVFSVQTTELPANVINPIDVPGGASLASMVEEFTLLSALPPANERPTLTIDATTPEPADAVTTGSFDIVYTTTDPETDAVTVAAEISSVVPSGAMAHYSLDTSVDGTVTVNQAAATAETPTIPAASVTVTLTPSDAAAGDPVTFTVAFAARMYEAPNQRPTATISTTEPTDAVETGSFDIVYTTADADNDTVTVDVTHTVSPSGAMAHYSLDTSVAGTVTVNQAAATAETPTIPAATVTVTLTPSDSAAGTAVTFSVAFAAKTYADPSATMLAAGDYLVVVRDKANPPPFGNLSPDMVSWSEVSDEAEMPDLERLFDVGGTIQLKVEGATRLQVVFSEVMWAVDEGQVDDRAAYLGEQWIELHNRTSGDNAKDFAFSDIKITTKEGRPALAEETDRISNVVGGGKDWVLGKGQNGNSGAADGTGRVEFISMYRNNEGEPGHQDNRWTRSSELYATNHRGTPGAKERSGVPTLTPTPANRGPVIFNEISNNTDAKYEWIELRNVSGGEVNLKNWEITRLTSKGDPPQDGHNAVEMIQFPGNDQRKMPAGSVLLVLATDPRNDEDHPIQTGWDITKGAGDQINGVNSDSPRYAVLEFKDGGMPDDGNFVLVLRNRQDRTSSNADNNTRDVAGYVPGAALKVDNDKLFTGLWPLANFPQPNWSKNQLKAGEVHRRQFADIDGTKSKDKDQDDKTAFRNVGWTGIGYRRNADANNQNGGTPGYPNNALQSNETQASADLVIISEIMYATGSRANIPQWIELRNLSNTVGINLDGWRLTVVNHDLDADGETYAGDLSKDYGLSGRIPPGQTFLLVAYAARNETNLPAERITSLRTKRGELVLSQYGFEITLLTKGKDNKDANRKVADKVGNLATVAAGAGRVRGNPQSYEDPVWALPAGTNDDGDRISIVRASIMGDPINGQLEGAWNRFDMSGQFVTTLDPTSYGHGTDISSPGHYPGGVLPVSLSKFRPERLKDTGEIVVRWITESELNNAGFNILRSEDRDGAFTKVQFVAGQGTTSERTLYEWKDKSAKPNVVYYYQIQDVSLDGEVSVLATTHLRGNVSAAGKLTTTWGELKALQ